MVLGLCYKILNNNFNMIRKQIIIHTFPDTLGRTCICGYQQQSTTTSFEKGIGSQHSPSALKWDKTSPDFLVLLKRILAS